MKARIGCRGGCRESRRLPGFEGMWCFDLLGPHHRQQASPGAAMTHLMHSRMHHLVKISARRGRRLNLCTGGPGAKGRWRHRGKQEATGAYRRPQRQTLETQGQTGGHSAKRWRHRGIQEATAPKRVPHLGPCTTHPNMLPCTFFNPS